MEALFSLVVGVLIASGTYLLLRGRTFPVIIGLVLLGYAVNLFLFSTGGLNTHAAAVIGESTVPTDPLPQAFVLTAIVIGFAMTAFVVILAIRARSEMGSDHVDGQQGEAGDAK
ncbi:Na+/H+ antiporter subunit C [Billgrantia endophytica]|uniref:Na+/H+ antiporter subunit C n=1 Tax=Billgrantia endophytica TaxID=2033802 RepID=A0A2N7U891_9GAMM|nr:Na+/H+ antiporter subunit C [Halomonas endophytica]PMR76655.1 Na+/H+ antiporter subunit C [Halomonas endophytica]